MKWFRWRENYSSSKGKWDYCLSVETLLEELGAEKRNENSWNEHYRGVEFEEIDKPPVEWLHGQVKELDERIQGLTRLRREYVRLLMREGEIAAPPPDFVPPVRVGEDLISPHTNPDPDPWSYG